MKCIAISKSTQRQCGNEAAPLADLCEYHSTMRANGAELVTTRGIVGTEPTGDAHSPASGGDVASPPPASADLFADLPEFSGPDAEEAAPPPPSDNAEELADFTRAMFGDDVGGETPPADPDPTAEGNPEDVFAAFNPAGGWTPETVSNLLRWAVNPKFERDGVAPLSEREIRDGGEAFAPVFNIMFGSFMPRGPWGVAGAWTASVVLPRYWNRIVEGLAWAIARITGRAAAPVATVRTNGGQPEQHEVHRRSAWSGADAWQG